MSKSTGAAEFPDGTRLYFIFNGTVSVALRPLFLTPDDAWAWDSAESLVFVEPENAKTTEEPVELLIDIRFEDDERCWLPSRASRKAMWITGPRSREEVQAEQEERPLY